MSISRKTEKRSRLSKELLGILGLAALISLLCYGFFSVMANGLVESYVEEAGLVLTEFDWMDITLWIQSISILSAVILFTVLFLFLAGERLSYVREIIKGIEALGRHDWAYKVPLEGNNELTELARRLNELSEEERAFQEKEKQMQEEKISLIRGLSHDIRTPLTSILSYSEYMQTKAAASREEISDYVALMTQKAGQIKALTDRLLDAGSRLTEKIENGQLLMEQLADEWSAELEGTFECCVDLGECPEFSGEFDVQELRRIFDNLASNVKKYASEKSKVHLRIYEEENEKGRWLVIWQSNVCRSDPDIELLESTKLGIESIRRIAGAYGGSVEVKMTEEWFVIEILLTNL